MRLGVTIGAIGYVVTQITWKDRLIVDGEAVPGRLKSDRGEAVFVTDAGRPIPLPPDADKPDAPVRFVPGILSIFSRLKVGYLLLAMACYPASIFLGAKRWQWLLASHNLDPGFRESVRLTWMGYLSNNVLPGATGGDFVKAVSIARRTPGRRTSAVMTVLLDRIIGMVALMLVGAVAVLLRSFWAGFDEAGALVLGLLAACVALGMMFFSRRVREILRIDWILGRIPFGAAIRKIDASLFHYRDHKWQLARCVLLSLVVWCWTLATIRLLGQSLSMGVATIDYFIYLPIAFTAGAFFPSINGLGVLEGLFQHFFTQAGAAASSAVALCLLYRLMFLVASLPGAIPLYAEISTRGVGTIQPLTEEEEEAVETVKAVV